MLVVHFEIHATDPQRLIEFYGDVFGWSFDQFGDAPYWVIGTGEGSVQVDKPGYGINGGLTQRQGPAPAADAPVNGCNVVIGVEDVDGVFEKALAAGATVALALEDMPGVGRLGYLHDPDGNILGVIAPEMPGDPA